MVKSIINASTVIFRVNIDNICQCMKEQEGISCVSMCLLLGLKKKFPYFFSSFFVIFLGSRDAELPILSLGSQYGATPFQKSIFYV